MGSDLCFERLQHTKRETMYGDLEATQIISQVAYGHLRPLISSQQDCTLSGLMVECWKENSAQQLTFEMIVVELDWVLIWVTNMLDSDIKRVEKLREHQMLQML